MLVLTPACINTLLLPFHRLLFGFLFFPNLNFIHWQLFYLFIYLLHIITCSFKEILLLTQPEVYLKVDDHHHLPQCTQLHLWPKLKTSLTSVEYDLFLFSPQGSKVQTRVGLLMLLCTWINNCPIAVTHFLHNQENVPFVSSNEPPSRQTTSSQQMSVISHVFVSQHSSNFFWTNVIFSFFNWRNLNPPIQIGCVTMCF